MKTVLQFNKSSRAAVKFVASSALRKPTLPILGNIHCYSNGHFEMSATDLDVTCIARIASQTEIEGKTTIPARALVEACAAETLSIAADENNLIQFNAENINRTVPGFSAADFPVLQKIQSHRALLKMPVVPFFAALKTVSTAISTDELRYVLNGVCFEIQGDKLTLIATNGRRLHMAQVALPAEMNTPQQNQIDIARQAVDDAEKALAIAKETLKPTLIPARDLQLARRGYYEYIDAPQIAESQEVLNTAHEVLQKLTANSQFIVPTKAIDRLLKMPVGKNAGEINVTFFEVPGAADEPPTIYARFDCGDFSVITKTIDGNYPNYRQVIPNETRETIVLNVEQFAKAIKQAATVCTGKSNSVKLHFEAGSLRVTGSSPEKGTSEAAISTNNHGAKLTIAFNPEYILEICEALSSCPEMTADFTDELSPGKFHNSAGLAVVMPMRLS